MSRYMLLIFTALIPAGLRFAEAASPTRSPESSLSVLRIATSTDGLEFTDADRVFLPCASAPDLVRLADGDILAVFDYLDEFDDNARPVLATSRSADEGRSLAVVQAVEFVNPPPDPSHVEHGDLVVMPTGDVRMYFTIWTKPGLSSGVAPCIIGCATTSDGLKYEIEPGVQLRNPALADAHATAAWFGSQLRLFVAGPGRQQDFITDGRRSLQRFDSRDGRRFKPSGRVRQIPIPDNIVKIAENRFRMYVTWGDDIRAVTSADGFWWKLEPEVCLARASDPAVIQLADGTWFMVYCPALSERAAYMNKQLTNLTQATHNDATDAQQAACDEPAELSSQQTDDGFAPKPDFRNRFDYVQWYLDSLVLRPGDNAYSGYAYLVTGQQDKPERQFNDLYYVQGDWSNGPGPWDLAAYPQWEESYWASQTVLAQFRAGSQDPRSFSCQGSFPDRGNTDDKPYMLVEMLLPYLATFRGLAKA